MNKSVKENDLQRAKSGRTTLMQVHSAKRRNLMRVLIDAIRYCHELEIIHRDIKVTSLINSLKIYC